MSERFYQLTVRRDHLCAKRQKSLVVHRGCLAFELPRNFGVEVGVRLLRDVQSIGGRAWPRAQFHQRMEEVVEHSRSPRYGEDPFRSNARQMILEISFAGDEFSQRGDRRFVRNEQSRSAASNIAGRRRERLEPPLRCREIDERRFRARPLLHDAQ
ncbi:MAG: hypothetical protein ABI054_09295, partial [Planctomycetota bacterium]